MIIRKAKMEDVNTIWEMGRNVSNFETAKTIVTFWPVSVLENCIDKEDVLILVVELENKIIGFIILNINQSLFKAEIENIYILEKYRKNGYGEELLTQALNELRNYNIENVCAMSDDIVEFLVKRGFTKGNQFYWMDLAFSDRFKR